MLLVTDSSSLRCGGESGRTLADRAWLVFLGWMAVVTAAYAGGHLAGRGG